KDRLGLEPVARQVLLVARIRCVHVAGEEEIESIAASAPMSDRIRPVLVDQRQVGLHAGFAHALDEILRDTDFLAGRARNIDQIDQQVAHTLGRDVRGDVAKVGIGHERSGQGPSRNGCAPASQAGCDNRQGSLAMRARLVSLTSWVAEDPLMKKTLALLALALSCLASPVTGVMAQNVPPTVVKELAPSGKLRAAINFGNIVLAQKDPAGGEPRGVSAELARELAKRLSVPIEYVTFDAAGKVFDALKTGAWDVAFLAIDPVRSEGIEFTGPYVVIEGAYLVPSSSLLQTNEDVDRDGVRVAVARGSAYDLYLTRTLKRAQLVREQSGPQALDMFLKDRLEAAAGVKQPIVLFAKDHPET